MTAELHELAERGRIALVVFSTLVAMFTILVVVGGNPIPTWALRVLYVVGNAIVVSEWGAYIMDPPDETEQQSDSKDL